MADRRRRIAALAGGAALALALTTGCAPDPAPSPTPTGFASDAEAYAAAEATYRAYLNASNARREDSASLPDPADFLTGEALTGEIKSASEFETAGVSLEGEITLDSFTPLSSTTGSVDAVACIDVSKTSVIDQAGRDVTPTERPRLQSLEITAVWTPTGTLISSSVSGEAEC